MSLISTTIVFFLGLYLGMQHPRLLRQNNIFQKVITIGLCVALILNCFGKDFMLYGFLLGFLMAVLSLVYSFAARKLPIEERIAIGATGIFYILAQVTTIQHWSSAPVFRTLLVLPLIFFAWALVVARPNVPRIFVPMLIWTALSVPLILRFVLR